MLVDLVDGADVLVIERRGGACFHAKTLQRLRTHCDVAGKKFERDATAEREILGFIDDPHAAAADFTDNLEVRNG